MVESSKQVFADLYRASIESYSSRTLFIEARTGRRVTYSEFNALVRTIMGNLPQHGISRQARVIICMASCMEFFAVFSALILVGACPVLSNPQNSSEEISSIAVRTDAVAVVASSALAERLGSVSVPVVWAETIATGAAKAGAEGIADATPGDLAYIIFSAGSTAAPKGCKVTQANLLSQLYSLRRAYALPENCVHLDVLPMYHASALFRHTLIPFSSGHTIVMAGEFSANDFWSLVAQYKVGFVQVVPSILGFLVNHPSEAPASVRDHLVFIGSASAPLSATLQENFEKRFGIPIAQGYGMTEATCGICLNDPRKATYRSGSVGQPLDIFKVQILGTDGRPLPPNEIGQIVVTGPGVVEGYLDNPTGSASGVSNGTLNTGDLGSMDAEGYVYIEGRESDQISRAGFKVSPKQVEETLLSIPGIDFAVVFGIPHETLGEDVIAYVRFTAEQLPERAMRAELGEKLARYKVPTRILPLDNELLANNFKAARGALRAKYIEQHNAKRSASNSVRPQNHPDKPRAFLWDDGIYLRPLMHADTESQIYIDNIQDPYVQHFTESGRFPQSEWAIESFWQDVKNPDHMVLAICDLANDQHVGNIALRVNWMARTGEIGRMIFREFQGAPYSDRALRLMMRYAFEDLGLKRLWGGGGNPSSVPSLIRMGFSHEGTLRRHHFLRGRWSDVFMMGILDTEYFEIKAGRRRNVVKFIRAYPDEIVLPLKEVFVDAFNVSPDEVNLESSPSDIPKWDSLGMVILWNLLEDKFGIPIDAGELVSVTTMGDIAEIIWRKMGDAPRPA